MNAFEQRRMILLAGVASLAGCAGAAIDQRDAVFKQGLRALEASAGGRLGVAAFDTGSQRRLLYRGDERFPMCSTFKLVPAAAMLARGADMLNTRVRYSKADLVSYSPITERHLDEGMRNAELCAATLQYSDNTAANLLMQQLGGPAGMTAFARSRGDEVFRLDRWETALNSAIPGDACDTTSPLAMQKLLQVLTLGEGLPQAQRQVLLDWMLGNTTGNDRMRAGVPAGWKVADKTGSGAYGSTNSIGLLMPPNRAPIVAAIYYTQDQADAPNRNEVVAAATRLIVAAV